MLCNNLFLSTVEDAIKDSSCFSDVDARYGQPLRVIDFGRSIDMKLFPAGTKFTTNCYTDDFQCVEMKEGRPWTTEVFWYS